MSKLAWTRMIGDVGTAVWWGGSLFGILALNPAVEVLDDPEERGKMVDEGWARFQPYGAVGLLAAGIAHLAIRRNPPRRPSSCYTNAARMKDVLFGVAAISSVASVALGEYSTEYDAGYAPIDADEDAPDEVQVAAGGLSVASWAQLVSGLGLLACGAIMAVEREK